MRTGGVGPLKEGKRWSERKDKRRKERWKLLYILIICAFNNYFVLCADV